MQTENLAVAKRLFPELWLQPGNDMKDRHLVTPVGWFFSSIQLDRNAVLHSTEIGIVPSGGAGSVAARSTEHVQAGVLITALDSHVPPHLGSPRGAVAHLWRIEALIDTGPWELQFSAEQQLRWYLGSGQDWEGFETSLNGLEMTIAWGDWWGSAVDSNYTSFAGPPDPPRNLRGSQFSLELPSLLAGERMAFELVVSWAPEEWGESAEHSRILEAAASPGSPTGVRWGYDNSSVFGRVVMVPGWQEAKYSEMVLGVGGKEERLSEGWGRVHADARGWLLRESLQILEPSGGCNVIFTSEPLDRAVTTEAYAVLQLRSLAEEMPDFEEVGFGPAQVFGERNGWRRVLRWLPLDGVPMTQIQEYWVGSGRSYVATATAPTARWDEFKDDLAARMAALRVEDPPL